MHAACEGPQRKTTPHTRVSYSHDLHGCGLVCVRWPTEAEPEGDGGSEPMGEGQHE